MDMDLFLQRFLPGGGDDGDSSEEEALLDHEGSFSGTDSEEPLDEEGSD